MRDDTPQERDAKAEVLAAEFSAFRREVRVYNATSIILLVCLGVVLLLG